MPKKTKQASYSQRQVNLALIEVKKGVPTRTAAAMFNVPRSTLYAKHKSRIPIEGAKGPATYLTSEEENILVHWILYCSERDFPVMKCQLLQCVQKLVNELKRQTPFKDNKPGRHWFENFCRRHPQIAQRVSQNLSASRASATEEVLRQWFLEVQQHLEKFGLLNIDPSRIFNLDESAFFLVPKADKDLARRGSKAVYKIVNGDEKESLTVLFTVSGNGVLLPPMILFWYERLPFSVTSSLPREWIAGSTERGWMTGESFYGYITTQFYPWLVKQNIQFPVVLFLDGHVSHLTLDLSQFCKAKHIELIALYLNATHVLQPLDVAVFHPLKAKWKSIVDEWRVENAGQRMRRENFAPLLKKSVDSINNLPQIIINGFKTCGLSPFNAIAVDFNILNKKSKTSAENTFEIENSSGIANNDQEEATKHLQFLENTIDADVLEDFQNTVLSGTWELSNSDNKGLFQYWLKMKRLSGQNISNNQSSEDDSRMQKTEDFVDSVPGVSTTLDGDLDINNLQIVTLLENNVNNVQNNQVSHIIDIEACKLVEGEISNLSVDSDINLFKDINQVELLQVDVNLENDENSHITNSSVKKVTKIDETLNTSNLKKTVLDEIQNKVCISEENLSFDKSSMIETDTVGVSAVKCNTNVDVPRVPLAFKKALIWPDAVPNKKAKKANRVSTILTSEEWQKYHTKIQEEKLRKQIEVQERKRLRDEAKKKKNEEKEAKKAIAEEKKKLNNEIKKLIAEKKKIIKKEK